MNFEELPELPELPEFIESEFEEIPAKPHIDTENNFGSKTLPDGLTGHQLMFAREMARTGLNVKRARKCCGLKQARAYLWRADPNVMQAIHYYAQEDVLESNVSDWTPDEVIQLLILATRVTPEDYYYDGDSTKPIPFNQLSVMLQKLIVDVRHVQIIETVEIKEGKRKGQMEDVKRYVQQYELYPKQDAVKTLGKTFEIFDMQKIERELQAKTGKLINAK